MGSVGSGMDKFRVVGVEGWQEVGQVLLGRFQKRQVVFLSGEVGAGKTTFVSEFLRAHGAEDVQSPTFALHNVYETAIGEVDHLDLYRLEGEEELEGMGFWDLFAKSRGLIFIEWPERLPEQAIPQKWPVIELKISLTPSGEREVTVVNG